MKSEEINEVIETLHIPGSGATEGNTIPVPRLQKLAMRMFGRACRIAVSTELSMEQCAAKEQRDRHDQKAKETAGLIFVKLALVLDQASEATVLLVDGVIVKKFYTPYRAIFRNDPSEEKDVNKEQISAVYYKGT
ncbi:unnamed protein product, partial [Prorocentrum cordatum]